MTLKCPDRRRSSSRGAHRQTQQVCTFRFLLLTGSGGRIVSTCESLVNHRGCVSLESWNWELFLIFIYCLLNINTVSVGPFSFSSRGVYVAKQKLFVYCPSFVRSYCLPIQVPVEQSKNFLRKQVYLCEQTQRKCSWQKQVGSYL